MTETKFEYINKFYGLNLREGSAVEMLGHDKFGRVVGASGAYIYILWDGDAIKSGPYHPTSGLAHLEEEGAA